MAPSDPIVGHLPYAGSGVFFLYSSTTCGGGNRGLLPGSLLLAIGELDVTGAVDPKESIAELFMGLKGVSGLLY